MTPSNYIEKRKYYRKKTHLSGSFIHAGLVLKSVTVVDLSRSGAKIRITDPPSEPFDIDRFNNCVLGTLIFHLDNPEASIVKKEASIRALNEKEGICEFPRFAPYDRLTRYLAGCNFSAGRNREAPPSEKGTHQYNEENFIPDIQQVFEELLFNLQAFSKSTNSQVVEKSTPCNMSGMLGDNDK